MKTSIKNWNSTNSTRKFIVLCLLFVSQLNYAQVGHQKIKLGGPRLGFTDILPGKTADDLKSNFNINPFISQFGWQFETQYYNPTNGIAGLIEVVTLIGGIEQGIILPSASVLVGMRTSRGFEMGMGPNLSLSGPALAIACGMTIRSGDMYYPINLAVVPSRDGIRLTLLFGFSTSKD